MTFWEQIDQAPVTLKHWILGLLPQWLQIPASILISIGAIIGVFALLFAFITWLERRGLGRMQNRQGPNRVGPFGLFQPIADGIKMIIKEDLVPHNADKALHFLAPVMLIVPALLALSMIPVGRNVVAIDFEAGVLLFFAIGASTELSVFMAGWGSHNKYSLLGSLRAIAQMISYELPLVISALAVIFVTGTMNTTRIVEMQTDNILNWYILSPWGLLGFATFLICALAESNRSPFDLPEAESELIAGHLTEYSGFKYALFFMAEYFGMMGISGMAITLFLGGWQAPLPMLHFMPSWFWFFSKLFVLIWIFIWVRATLPRLRADQLMDLAWKFFLPLGLLNLVCAGVWAKAGPLWGWGTGLALLLPSIFGLGRLLRGIRPAGGRRVYQFAD